MKRTIIAWTGALLFGLASSAQAGVEDKEIAQHIKDLSVEDSAVRTQAIRYLGNLGAAGRLFRFRQHTDQFGHRRPCPGPDRRRRRDAVDRTLEA
jgi:hypothetical protein